MEIGIAFLVGVAVGGFIVIGAFLAAEVRKR